MPLAGAFLAFGPLPAQDGTRVVNIEPRRGAGIKIETHTAHLRVDSDLVLIPVHVTTRSGLPVTGLTANDFQILEDGQEQAIRYFAVNDAPVSIGLVFDSSGSMKEKMGKSIEAAAQLLKSANQEDEFFLVDFNERARLAVPFTRDLHQVSWGVAHTRPRGRTALLDAVHLALGQMKKAHHLRRALVILSDGADNVSRRTPGQVKNESAESDVQIYAMGLYDNAPTHLTREELRGPGLLDDIAGRSGGRQFRISDMADLPSTAARISAELRSEYLLGYTPSAGVRDGKYRKVRLQMKMPGDLADLRIDYRRGYYSPTE